MSCCQRPTEPVTERWLSASAPRPAVAEVPERLRFNGAQALSLPVGHRRVLVRPGEELLGLSGAERELLWRTGLFGSVL